MAKSFCCRCTHYRYDFCDDGFGGSEYHDCRHPDFTTRAVDYVTGDVSYEYGDPNALNRKGECGRFEQKPSWRERFCRWISSGVLTWRT